MGFKFEKLIAWQKAVELSNTMNNVCKEFPKDELYILTSQIKRAADSVSLNIAEGSTGQSNAEFKRFLNIALRSCIEIVGCIYLAKSRSIISDENFKIIYEKCEEESKIISGLKNSL